MERPPLTHRSMPSMPSTRKKIIYVIDDLQIGGAAKVVLDICSSVDLDRYDISIYLMGDRMHMLESYSLDPRIAIRTFGIEFDQDFSFWAYLSRGLRPSVSSENFRKVLEAAEVDQPDLLHVHLMPRDLNIGILIRERTGCALLYTQHLSNFSYQSLGTKLLGLILRLTYRKYDIIAVSTSVRDEIVENKLVGTKRTLFLIENKLNLESFVPTLRSTRQNLRVVYVARISSSKGHEDLLRAWTILQEEAPGTKLILVGPDGMDGQVQFLAKELNVAASVEFVGPHHRVVEVLNDSDIAVFPSHQEGLPLALLEKMAMQLPVIVSDIPSLLSIVEDNENGLVFRCRDSTHLAQKLAMLIRDPDLRKRLGEKGRKTVEERFGSRNIALPNEAVYEEIFSRE